MKKILLLLLAFPILGIGQTIDLASYALTSNGTPTTQTFVQGGDFRSGQNPITFGTTGALVTAWNNNDIVHYRYFEVSISATTGNNIWVSALNFQQASIPNGGTPGPSTYLARYAIVSAGTTPDDFQFFTNESNLLVNEESIAGNTTKSISINESLSAGQKLVIRFYTKGNDYNNIKWQIQPNTLKFRGYKMGPLSGLYKIGSTADSFFSTLTSAINTLNNVGVEGKVDFSLENTIYNRSTKELFPYIINNYTGNGTYKVTFKPGAGKTVTIESTNLNGTSVPAVFKINGADNIVFDGSNAGTNSNNLTIYNNNTINPKKSVIWIASQNSSNGANDIEIKNLTLKQYYRDDDLSVGVFSGGTGTIGDAAEAANSNNILKNITFTKVGQAIYLNGNGTTLSTGWKIQNNTIGGTTTADKPFVGVVLNNAKDYEVSGNSMIGLLRNTTNNAGTFHSGVLISGNSNGKIFNNIIRDVSNNTTNGNSSGIYIDSGNNIIYNNMISNIYSGPFIHGIILNSGAGNKIYNNTVVMNASTSISGSACLYIGGGSAIGIKNNIFYSSQSTANQYLINSNVNHSNITELNNNNYYTANAAVKVGRLVSQDYNTFTNWQDFLKTSNKETFSINVEPKFISISTTTTDLHLIKSTVNSGIDAKGSPIATITTDIDNEDRDTATPDIGADEIFLCEKGDQTSYGINEWRGYVYKWTGNPAPTVGTTPDPNTTTYVGYVTEDAIFDRNVVAGAVTGKTANICGTAPSNAFFVRYKMQLNITEAGMYNLTVGADDGYRLYIDGTLVTDINNWNTHNYISSATNKELSVGNHLLVLDYFENISDSRVSFSYGLIKGDTALPFGINEWNVYAFTSVLVDDNSFPIPTNSYAGSYVEKNVNIKTEDIWEKTTSPSNATNTGYKGAPIPKDDFTISYRRTGFPCGRYSIEIANCDDNVQVIIDNVPVYTAKHNVNDNTPETANNSGNNFPLNETSKVEIRFKEYTSHARLTLSFKDNPVNYDGSIAPPSGSSIIVNSDLTLSSNLDVCSCTVATNKKITVPENIVFTIRENTVINAGAKIIIQNNGSFVQTNDKGTYTGAGVTDSFEYYRNTTPLSKFDFTFWSSPVAGFTLYKLSPTTFYDKYQYYEPGVGWKTALNGAKVMDPGVGYNVRGPQEIATESPKIYNAKFTGIPNNGIVTVAVKKTATSTVTSNLVGNPYPSAIDADAFYLANKDLIKGTLYFWTHAIPLTSTPNSDGKYQYNNANYISYNITGGTGSVDPSVCKSCGGQKSNQYIASGQGFIVEAKASGDLKFTNALRVTTANNNKFSKQSNTKKEVSAIEKNRIWLNMKNEAGTYNEMLLGYITGATNGLDEAYDGTSYATGTGLYSLLDGKKLVIQGRDLTTPIENDVIPLGFISNLASEYTIGIESFDGFFSAAKVLLKDKLTNTTTNLKEGRYTFTADKGTFNERFELSFAGKTLGIENPLPQTEKGIAVSKKQNQIEITSADDNIQSIQIYDLAGKILYNKTGINAATFTTGELRTRNQIVIVKIQTENNTEITKKILL